MAERAWLTPDEAAAHLNVNPTSLRRMEKKGQVPSVRFGRVVRFITEDLDQLLLDRTLVEDRLTRDAAHQHAILAPRQAAEYLGISTRTLWSMTKSGTIGHTRIGRLVKYRPEDLDEYIRSATVAARPQDRRRKSP